MSKPIIAIVCDTYTKGPHMYHSAGDKYIRAVRECMGAIPLLLPSLEENAIAADELFEIVDGFLITGGYSNIQRHHYGDDAAPEGENEDPARDANTLPLVKAVVEAGVPMLGICRGHQELNVTMGGSLYPRVHEIDGHFDHRADDKEPVETQYGPAHSVSLREDGPLFGVIGEREFMVNTIHEQAVKDVAPGLSVEAEADDGTIEALSVDGAKAFALTVQWHPEWKATENPQSVKLFEAFKSAALNYKASKKVK